jgi:integrase
MSSELITSDGKRKYLTQDERERFLAAAAKLDRGEVRTLCMTLAYTGCRISEALECDAARVDFSGKAITFRTLKQRDKLRYRSVPVPDELLSALDNVHGVRRAQKRKQRGEGVRLWSWGRTQASKHIYAVMDAAGISGAHASPKGLRHGFGVRVAKQTRNPRLVQKMLGHANLETTAIYMDLVGLEAREEMALTW